MWNLTGKAVDIKQFHPFEPEEVLYEFDGPRIFTLNDADGELNLAYWSDEDDKMSRYVVVPTTTKIVAALREGSISVYDALNQPRCWLCDVTHPGDLSACQRVPFEAVPRDSLPEVGTLLLPTLATNTAIRSRSTEPQLIDLVGRIRELDKDRLSFDLREIEGTARTQRFVFAEELLGEVFQAFEEDVRVQVAGRTFPVKNLAYALALSRLTVTET
jgi:hypothetical protein